MPFSTDLAHASIGTQGNLEASSGSPVEIQTRDRVGWNKAGREETKPSERGTMERRTGKERCNAMCLRRSRPRSY